MRRLVYHDVGAQAVNVVFGAEAGYECEYGVVHLD